jgi:hypothetical protein
MTMYYKELKPPSLLAKYVQCFWMMPKKLNVISSLNAARLDMMFSGNPDVLVVALKYGNYDYSHFSIFKQFIGITPKEYMEWI